MGKTTAIGKSKGDTQCKSCQDSQSSQQQHRGIVVASADNAALMAAYRASLAAPAVSAAGPKPAAAVAPAASAAAPAAGASPALRATPKARRYAQSKGIDLAEVALATGASMITEAIIMQYEEGLKK